MWGDIMSATWTVENNTLTHIDLPARIDYLMQSPYPPFWWIVSDGIFTHTGLPMAVIRGAFANCNNLDTAHIPESCKSLGAYTFRNTALTAVTIANNCQYSTTTCPEECEINYYEDYEDGESNE